MGGNESVQRMFAAVLTKDSTAPELYAEENPVACTPSRRRLAIT